MEGVWDHEGQLRTPLAPDSFNDLRQILFWMEQEGGGACKNGVITLYRPTLEEGAID